MQSVRLIRADLWKEDEERFLDALFAFEIHWDSPPTATSLDRFPLIYNSGRATLIHFFDASIRELDGMTGCEVIDHVAKKRARQPTPWPRSADTPFSIYSSNESNH